MPDPTVELLRRWHDGDRSALDALLAETLPWLQLSVRPALTPDLRRTEDSLDFAQSAVVKFLTHGPRFLPESQAQFRALMKRIALNEIIDQKRRSRRVRERSPADPSSTYGDSVLDLQGTADSATSPSRVAAREEERAWVRLALELLPDADRHIVHAREVEERDWNSIAEEFGLETPDAARMRCVRILPRLANLIRKVRAGRLNEVVERQSVAQSGTDTA